MTETKTARRTIPWWGKLLLLFFGICFFVVLELALEFFNCGDNVDLFIPRETYEENRVMTWNAGYHQRAFNYIYPLYYYLQPFNREASWGLEMQHEFLTEKPEDGLRVFLMGSSSVRGYPLGRGYAFGTILEKMLNRAAPDRVVEVINPTDDAMSSTMVRRLFDESVDYEPDVMVFYLGHNEFYGVCGVGSTMLPGMWGWPGVVFTWLQKTRLYRLMKNTHREVMFRLGDLRAKMLGHQGREPDKPVSLIDNLPGVKNISPANRLSRAATTRFRNNLEHMVKTSLDRGITVVLMTVDSTLKNLYPLGSQPEKEIPAATRKQWKKLFENGRRFLAEDQVLAADDNLRQAAELAPLHAETWYLWGLACHKLGRTGEGLKYLRRSRDLDRVPFRARSDINAVIRALAEKYSDNKKLLFIDTEHLFARNSTGGVTGADLFLEHVHFTFKGKFLVAREILNVLGQSGLNQRLDFDLDRVPDNQEYYRKILDLGLLENLCETNFMLSLYHAFPFKNQYDAKSRIKEEKTRWREMKSKLNEAESRAVSKVPKGLSGNERAWAILMEAARLWHVWGAPQQARRVLKKLIRVAPNLWFGHNYMGKILMDLRLPGQAVKSLKRAIYLHDQFGWDMELYDKLKTDDLFEVEKECALLAEAYAIMGYREETVRWLREAARRGFTNWEKTLDGPVGRYVVKDMQELIKLLKDVKRTEVEL